MSLQKIGIFIDAEGIGDQLQFTSIPENYYKNTGEKKEKTENEDIKSLNFSKELNESEFFKKRQQLEEKEGQEEITE